MDTVVIGVISDYIPLQQDEGKLYESAYTLYYTTIQCGDILQFTYI